MPVLGLRMRVGTARQDPNTTMESHENTLLRLRACIRQSFRHACLGSPRSGSAIQPLADDRQPLQHGIAVAFQFAAADARDAGQVVQIVGRGFGDRPQGAVVEDHVGRHVLFARGGRAPVAQGVEARQRGGSEVGYDRRGWRLQTAIAGVLFPLGVLAGTPEQNLNWMYAPFGLPQTVLDPVLFAIVAVPLAAVLLFLPGDWIARRLLLRWPVRRAVR